MRGAQRPRSCSGEHGAATREGRAMRALTLKLVRDAWRTRAQVASIGLVLAGGVLCVMAIRGSASSLTRARDDYYRRAHFADVFASLTRAPDEVATRLAAVPGVAGVATRVVKDV